MTNFKMFEIENFRKFSISFLHFHTNLNESFPKNRKSWNFSDFFRVEVQLFHVFSVLEWFFDENHQKSSKIHSKTEKTRNSCTSARKKSEKIEKIKKFEPTEIFILDHRTYFCGRFPTVYAVSWWHLTMLSVHFWKFQL